MFSTSLLSVVVEWGLTSAYTNLLRSSGSWHYNGQQEELVATARMLFQSTPRSTNFCLNVDGQVIVGRPRHLPLPRGVHDMAWLAGRPGGILMMWPAIRSRLSATMSCNLRCPVLTACSSSCFSQCGLKLTVTELLVNWKKETANSVSNCEWKKF